MDKNEVIPAELYKNGRELFKIIFQFQADYSKWILASLLTINTAAIGFITHIENFDKAFLPHIIIWFFVGIIFAMLCGAAVWINYVALANIYNRHQPHTIFDVNDLLNSNRCNECIASFSINCGSIMGVGSLIMFVLGGLSFLSYLPS